MIVKTSTKAKLVWAVLGLGVVMAIPIHGWWLLWGLWVGLGMYWMIIYPDTAGD